MIPDQLKDYLNPEEHLKVINALNVIEQKKKEETLKRHKEIQEKLDTLIGKYFLLEIDMYNIHLIFIKKRTGFYIFGDSIQISSNNVQEIYSITYDKETSYNDLTFLETRFGKSPTEITKDQFDYFANNFTTNFEKVFNEINKIKND